MQLESLNNCSQSFSEFSALGPEQASHVLGAIGYFSDSLTRTVEVGNHAPLLRVSMPPLADTPVGLAEAVCDVWLSDSALSAGQCGDVQYRHDGSTLFGVIELAETEGPPGSSMTPLQHTSEQAYRQIFAVLEAQGYPFLFRLWNYMADINGHSHGLERYRQFNLGRQDAFLACRREVEGNVPAACALGSASGPLTIAFMAGRQAPLALENPRQISAYHYPPSYGPRSPTFSRASLVRMGPEEVLLISGTASIVGHDTLHAGDVRAQTMETLTNLDALIQVANREATQPLFSLAHLFFRVYVRHGTDVEAIRDVMQRRMGANFDAIFLQADVCRQDLLMEIEASASLPV